MYRAIKVHVYIFTHTYSFGVSKAINKFFRAVSPSFSQELCMVCLMTSCHLYLDKRFLVPYNINDSVSFKKEEGLTCQRLQMNI